MPARRNIPETKPLLEEPTVKTSAKAARRLAAGRGLALASALTAGAWAAPPARVAVHDAASKRMAAAVLELSRVLTPEQRKQMADDKTQRRETMQRHCRERQAIEAPKG